MASGLKGMNIEQGRALAKACHTDADQITQLTSKLTQQLHSTEWLGHDADMFRNQWQSEYSTALKKVAHALVEASQHLNKEADAQEQASNS